MLSNFFSVAKNDPWLNSTWEVTLLTLWLGVWIQSFPSPSLVAYLDYVLRMSIDLIKENGFTLKRQDRQYPAESMTDADYADDQALITNDHVTLVAQISLTLSRHSSLSFIALGRSSGQHPVSSHSCWMYVHVFPKLNPCCIACSKQQEALASMWTQIKQNSCILNKKEPSPL